MEITVDVRGNRQENCRRKKWEKSELTEPIRK
jgi:hypothetical protein